MYNNNNDIDAFVNIVAKKQKNRVDNKEMVSSFKDDGEVLKNKKINNNKGRKKKKSYRKKIKFIAYTTAISMACQSFLTLFNFYNAGVRKVADDVYSSMHDYQYSNSNYNGDWIVFSNKEGKTYAASGLTSEGLTAWHEAAVEDFQKGIDKAVSYNYSESDIYNTYSVLNFNGFKDLFSEETKKEASSIEKFVEYVSIGREELSNRRSR